MSYRTAIPYCYRDPNGTYYFRLALNKELRMLVPLLPQEVRLSLLTKRRQKAKGLALSLAQSLLSQQAVLVQMANENASGKDIFKQHLRDIEEHRHLIRMSAEDKLAYIPESVAKTVAEGLERESLKNGLISIITDLEKELADKKHGIVQRKRLMLAEHQSQDAAPATRTNQPPTDTGTKQTDSSASTQQSPAGHSTNTDEPNAEPVLVWGSW